METRKDEILKRRSKLSLAQQELLTKRLRGEVNSRSQLNVIPKRAQISPAPLSFSQQRLWFLQQLDIDNPYYSELACVQLLGALKMDALERSLNEIVQRHEALRTTFEMLEEEAIQIIHPAVTVTLPLVNLLSMSEAKRQEQVERLTTEIAKKPFDLMTGPLLRVMLLQTGAEEYLLLFTIHHIAVDGWSIGVLIRELARLYEAFSTGKASPLADISIQYADFAIWQRQWLQGELQKTQLDYWKQQLADVSTLALPTNRPRPAVQSFRGAVASFELSASLTDMLRSLSNQEGVTLFMTLLGAFQALLYRYTGQEDICVGSPIANRNQSEIQGLIGFFVNTLVLRTHLSGNPSFLELLNRVREVCVGAYAHADIPFEQLVEELHPDRNLSQMPLFQVMFAWQEDTQKELTLPGLTLNWLPTHGHTAKFDLSLYLVDGQPKLRGFLEYNTDLFDAETVTRIVKHFCNLLEGIVANPQARLSDLPLLTAEELHQQLVEWNNTQVEYPQQQCIHQLFEAQVERTPDAVAVVFEDKQLTYCELNARANQLAHYLRKLGVKPEILVGICVERSSEMLPEASLDMVIGLLAILKAGGAYVPLDPNYPKERLAYMLFDTQLPILLTQQYLVEQLPAHKAHIVCLDTHWDQIAQESETNLINTSTVNNLAYVIYTSGSTGKPKGVLGLHQGAVNRFHWMWKFHPFTEEEVCCQKTSLNFVDSVWEIFGPLLQGITTVIVPEKVVKDPQQFITSLANNNVTRLVLVPSLLRILLNTYNLLQLQLPKLKLWISSGEALSTDLLVQFRQSLPDSTLLNLYGSSEVSADVTCGKITPQTPQTTSVLIGRPIANTQIHILDTNKQPVPLGVPGEIYVGGHQLARGYLNRPDLTAEKFIPHPFSIQHSVRLYKTGDLARYLPTGEIEYIGRIDHQSKIRGFRIELGEIEFVINQYPPVRESLTVVEKNSVDSKRLVAYVVPQKEQTLVISELRSFLESKLPNYMIPGAFVILEALPLTPNGKVDRKALPAPELTQLSSSNHVPPTTPIENLLAGIWAEILGLNKISIHENFFALGGHSLIATCVISQIRQVFHIELPLRCLFEKPTIAGLAKEIEIASQANLGIVTTKIEPIVRSPQLPLSFAQQRLWFLAQLEPDSPFYNIPVNVRLQGKLNFEALQQSFDEILRRHEALRTNFQTVEGQAIAVIKETKSLVLPLLDLSELTSDRLEFAVKQQAVQEAQTPFDLTSDLLLRVKLLRLDAQEHIVLVTMHHIVSDAWSIGVLVQELAKLYPVFCNQQPTPLTELPIQYVDFAAWQRQWLQAEVLQSQLSYWRKQLENTPKVLELPADYPRPAIQTFRGATYSFELSDELSVALNKFSHQQGSTLFMTLLAAFQTLLWRYTGQEDIVVGSPIANRNRAEIEGLIGFFVNTLVLRTNLAGNPSFEELLKRVREVALGAYTHQDLPFELLVEQLQPQRDLSHTPLFQVMFVLQNAPISTLELPDLTLTYLHSNSDSAKFDLTLNMIETESGLVGSLEYNTDLFEQSTIWRLVGHLQTLLTGIVANPQQRLSELPLLSESERHQLLVQWNDTEVEYPHQLCTHQLFEAQVERTPDAVAVVFGDKQLTYRELNTKANQLGHYLRSLGVKPEVLVGICVERSLSMVIGLLAILKAGGAYIPLDPSYPHERLAFILKDAQVPVLLTQASLVEEMPQHKAKVVCLDRNWQKNTYEKPYQRDEDAARAPNVQQSKENLCSDLTPDNVVYVIYTSGSTGKPKGVQITHSALSNFLYSMRQRPGLTQEDTLLAVTTYSFDIAALEIFLPIIVGGRLVIASREVSLDGTQLSAKLKDSKATVMQATPATWQMLLTEGWSGNEQLKILCGGEALPEYLANQLLHRCASLWNMYGPTETTIWSAASQVERDSKVVAISHPITNTQFYILDQHTQLVPVGVAGELHIGGDGLARGYLNRPDLTAEKFIPNPFSKKAARLYKTGDLARYLPNGEIEYISRIDHQVKVRGFRIELLEIEAVINQYPEVRESVVMAREDSSEGKSLVAYLVQNPEHQGSDEETTKLQTEQISQRQILPGLRNFLESKLPNYMVPSAFVMLKALPLTPNGKVDRKALPAPDTSRSHLEKVFVAPQNPFEEVVTGIWVQVLNREQIGIYDNFFELGGHSLLATQVISRINKAFEIDLSLHRLFESPTVVELAKSIQEAMEAELGQQPPTIRRVSRVKNLPLSFAQARLWLLEQLQPGNAMYSIPIAVRLVGLLNVAALEQAFAKIVSRHEALRTTFHLVNGQPFQVIASSLKVRLPVVDLRELPEAQREALVQQLIIEESQRCFDLVQGPLLRCTLLHIHEQEYILLFTIHHIVSDGWSMGVFVRELVALYEAFSAGKSSPLPELAIQYADFAAWQRQWLQGDVLETQLAYWKKQLSNLPVMKLPTTRPRAEVKTNLGDTSSFLIPAKEFKALQALSRQEGVTLFMTLLAGFQVLLQRYTNQDDIVVGTDVANRNQPETEPLIGFFVNLLVLRTDLAGNPSFRELLKRVRQVALGAYTHQDLPFDQLVKALQPERNLSNTPSLFQVLFVLQNAPMPPLELPGLTLSLLEVKNEIAKFDLALFLTETDQGIVGNWQYNADLFETSIITRMTDHFKTLLNSIISEPDARINSLEMLTEAENKQQTMQKQERKAFNREKFISIAPKAVTLSPEKLIKTSYLQTGQTFPLVIQPDTDEIDLGDWAKTNRKFIETELLKHGAILFRNFHVNSVSVFESVAQGICPELFSEYGDLPRAVEGSKVYGSTPYPADKAILFHNESSHLHCWPLKIWFFCVQPAQQGGETPIIDCRQAYQILNPQLRERLAEKQLMYVRNYTDDLDVSWQDFFHTNDKSVVENYCRQARVTCEWYDNKSLITRQIRPAIAVHPKTSDRVFFNQIQLHHIAYLDVEVRESLLSLFGEQRLPRNVYYGDGTSIEDSVIAEINEVYHQAETSFSWQQGDILMLDNMLAAHGRYPYVGQRKIVVAMGEMICS
ncbi:MULTISPECIES: non-ribosomal peptide synthetase [Nostoc]|uniref:Amino acid adenylation domain-containing protein n=1 Tax=Nostoc punctiforme FACHB-252 TaxID=1357509 RepID=A0ABR8HIK1_NOSPU|nr:MULTISPECIES: non-ribosomal peptide synthetase [Nostoc]MBC1236345.1 amino acid adenylation domain-containing protein [Nostoc sp. 2RC]MBD2615678.1 amino acid adenylation domain-containing protein [Nostoc punctiforme FACHB-252]